VRCYLSGPYSWREKIKAFEAELIALGIESTASWLYETAPPEATLDQFTDEQNRETAEVDIVDIRFSHVVVVFTVDPLGPAPPRGGRHWETGYAYAEGKEIVIIGPRENVFSYLGDIKVFATPQLAKRYLHKRSLN